MSHAVIERRNIFYAQNLSLIGNGAAANPDAVSAVKRNKPIPYARSISMDGVFAGAQKTFVKNLVRYAYRIAVGTSHGRREHVLTADVKTQKTRTGKSYLTKPVSAAGKGVTDNRGQRIWEIFFGIKIIHLVPFILNRVRNYS